MTHLHSTNLISGLSIGAASLGNLHVPHTPSVGQHSDLNFEGSGQKNPNALIYDLTHVPLAHGDLTSHVEPIVHGMDHFVEISCKHPHSLSQVPTSQDIEECANTINEILLGESDECVIDYIRQFLNVLQEAVNSGNPEKHMRSICAIEQSICETGKDHASQFTHAVVTFIHVNKLTFSKTVGDQLKKLSAELEDSDSNHLAGRGLGHSPVPTATPSTIPTATTTSHSRSKSKSTSELTPSPTPPAEPRAKAPKRKFSKGKKVAVALGTIGGVGALALFLLWVRKKYRKRAQHRQTLQASVSI